MVEFAGPAAFVHLGRRGRKERFLGAEIYNAGEQKYVSYELTIPLYDDSVPSDWQQRVLGQWVVFRTEVDGDVCNPAEEGKATP